MKKALKKTMKPKNCNEINISQASLIALLIIFLVLGFIVGEIYYYEPILKTFEFEADINVFEGRYSTFNLDKDKMHFGGVVMGNGARRRIVIENDFDFLIRAEIRADDSVLGGWSHFNSSVYLEPHTKKTETILVLVPQDAAIGGYSGKYIVTIYKSRRYE